MGKATLAPAMVLLTSRSRYPMIIIYLPQPCTIIAMYYPKPKYLVIAYLDPLNCGHFLLVRRSPQPTYLQVLKTRVMDMWKFTLLFVDASHNRGHYKSCSFVSASIIIITLVSFPTGDSKCGNSC